jgi:phosphoglycerate kinase
MSSVPTLDKLDVRGRRVLLRVDLNVPMREGQVTDVTRIERVVPTINELTKAGAKVILLSHLGRPKGKVVGSLSLRPVAEQVSRALGEQPVRFAEDCVGEAAQAVVAGLGNGEVALLENLRFHAGEEANDPEFAKRLAELGDFYVNDAFSAAHRAHASTEALARRLPAAAGRLMQAEIEALTLALESPERPLAAVVGGAKISTKIDVLTHLASKVEALIIGGGMANTFLHALGSNVGASLCEKDLAATAREIVTHAEAAGCQLLLPTDAVVARELAPGITTRTTAINEVAKDELILDIGPRTVADWSRRLASLRTLVWNGPVGAFEVPPFDAGTCALAREAARLTRSGNLRTIAGGGDTVAALGAAGVLDAFTYVSTAGGAFLEWLEGRELPGIAALKRGDGSA